MTLSYDGIMGMVLAMLIEQPDAEGVGGHFQRIADAYPARTAVVCGDERRTFGEVEAEANRLARALAGRGVGQGDWVAVLLPNSVEFVEVMVAAWKLGATVVPVSHRLPAREREEVLELAKARVAVDVENLPALLEDAAAQAADPHPDRPTQPWKAIPSGGSTGRPKLIVDPSRGPVVNGPALATGMRPGGVSLVGGPLYHNGPFGGAVLQLMAGGTAVLMERFDAEAFLVTIERETVNWVMAVPTMLHRIVSLPEAVRTKYDLSSLDVLFHMAAACPQWLKRQTIELFGAERVWELYGATEVGGTVIGGDDWLRHPGSVGRAMPSIEIRVFDDDGRELPAGEVGEIWCRPFQGPTFEYRGAAAREDGGFVSVGDLGHLDEAGYLYISDRRTDLIVTGGANVYPAEVEGALLEHPDVFDVGVVGLHDHEWGQRVHAIVQPVDALAPPSADELLAHVRERLAAYKLPKAIEFVDELPRDPSGKLRRSVLRAARESAST